MAGAADTAPQIPQSTPLSPLETFEDLKLMRIWIGWKRKPGGNKICCWADTGRWGCKWKEEVNRRTYDELDKSLFDGIGIMLPENFLCIDLDHCFVDGVASADAKKLITECNSYTEISPSGNGIHILLKTSANNIQNFDIKLGVQKVEVKTLGSYVTVTEKVLGLEYTKIAYRDNVLEYLYNEYNKTRPIVLQKPKDNKPKEYRQSYVIGAVRSEASNVRKATQGSRRDTLFNAAMKLKKYIGVVSESYITTELRMAMSKHRDIPRVEVERTIQNGFRYSKTSA